MEKILFTYGSDVKEGFTSMTPLGINKLNEDSIDEVEAIGVAERIPNLIEFIETLYRVLKVGSKATFVSSHYRNDLAWANPYNIRGISELSLNFASKQWRENSKFIDSVSCDFEVVGNFAIESSFMQRSEDARGFMIKHYNNVVQSVIFTLTKKAPNEI